MGWRRRSENSNYWDWRLKSPKRFSIFRRKDGIIYTRSGKRMPPSKSQVTMAKLKGNGNHWVMQSLHFKSESKPTWTPDKHKSHGLFGK